MQLKAFSYSFKILIAGAIVLMCAFDSIAQFQQFPLEHQNTNARQRHRGGREKTQIDTLKLPFWDDFTVTSGGKPDTTKWMQGARVFVGNTMGKNQPTVNVATFDGLDSIGNAYDALQILETGFNDVLTSQNIDLSLAEVSESERPGVFLTFAYQWKGNGEAPDPSDFLQVQFMDVDSTWNEILKIETKSSYVDSVFYDAIINVPNEAQYFHQGFRFRIRNFGRKSGPFDTWNLDYFYMNKGRDSTDVVFRDRSIGSPLTSPFGDYVAIPYKHFKLNNTVEPMFFDIANLYDSVLSLRFTVDGKFTSYSSDTVVTTKPLHDQSIRVEPLSRVTNIYDSLFIHREDPTLFNPDAKGMDMELKISLLAGDKPHPSGAFDFRLNDTISTKWSLRDYYAYDDGTAEYSAGLIEPGTNIAYQFQFHNYGSLINVNAVGDTLQGDTLKAITYYFPAYGISSNQAVTFKIYKDHDGQPRELLGSYGPRTLKQNPIGVFETLPLVPALVIDEAIFYIGWEQPPIGKALIGLDVDNDTGDKIFISETRNQWYQNDQVKGSLMLRPVFGNAVTDITDGVEEEEERISVSVYPNPNGGSFYVEGVFDQLKVLNATGAEVSFEQHRLDDKSFVQLNKPSGLYLVRVFSGLASRTYKVIISR